VAGPKPVYTVQVREVVEFVLRRGDLGGERAFVGPNRALAGTRGHQRLQRARPAGYQKEVSLRHDLETDDFILRIRGRIDGLVVAPDGVVLEEIKTVQGAWDATADPLHWAQARLYGHLYALGQPLDCLTLRLTYLHLETDAVTEFQEARSAADLAQFFSQTVAIYLAWIRERHEWCRRRDASIQTLDFPFARYRPGQRQLAVAAYRACAAGGRLFLEAPTGIGKTISVLFPAVKALAEGKLERIFYLTARTLGRAIAEQALTDLRTGGLELRAVTLTAREKVCQRDGHPCELATCPLAIGYYDRRHSAIRAALEHGAITRSVLETVGQAHQVCPFELALDVSSWADAVIGDYNYAFDPQVYLRRHFGDEGGDYALLVDESHNLVDRAREMFSAGLDGAEIQSVRRAIKASLPKCARALNRILTALRKLSRPADADDLAADDASDAEPLLATIAPAPVAAAPLQRAGAPGVLTRRDLPEELLPLIEAALKEAEVWLAQNQPADFRDDLLSLYFALHSFRRTAEAYDERYVTILESPPRLRIRLFCLDPSAQLGIAVSRGKTAIFFSATLTPVDYYRALLGGVPEDPMLQLPSPFPTEHLAVLVHDRIQTNFKARGATVPEVVDAIIALIQGRRGNYLVYFPSYQYLTDVRELFQQRHPEATILTQQPGMTEGAREEFLAAFTTEHGATLVGFAVLGGIFGEGIDLVGERLIGAVIVGVGLPQLSVERDLIRDHFQERTGSGFEYAYTFPGMNRVLQAIGRVIRSETDRGVVLLIDTRFAETRYRRLFPAWWQARRVRTTAQIKAAVESFWSGEI
jgi:DNA excision repair protein ERCC-2